MEVGDILKIIAAIAIIGLILQYGYKTMNKGNSQTNTVVSTAQNTINSLASKAEVQAKLTDPKISISYIVYKDTTNTGKYDPESGTGDQILTSGSGWDGLQTASQNYNLVFFGKVSAFPSSGGSIVPATTLPFSGSAFYQQLKSDYASAGAFPLTEYFLLVDPSEMSLISSGSGSSSSSGSGGYYAIVTVSVQQGWLG
ncbi:hypothetical protein [Thermococcus prieurii]